MGRIAILLALLVLASTALAGTQDGVTLETDLDAYPAPLAPAVVPVCFTFTNARADAVFLPGSAPWRIVDARGNVAFAPIGTDEVVPLAPGESSGGCWHGYVFFSPLPEPGDYAVEWDYFLDDDAGLRTLADPFRLERAA